MEFGLEFRTRAVSQIETDNKNQPSVGRCPQRKDTYLTQVCVGGDSESPQSQQRRPRSYQPLKFSPMSRCGLIAEVMRCDQRPVPVRSKETGAKAEN